MQYSSFLVFQFPIQETEYPQELILPTAKRHLSINPKPFPSWNYHLLAGLFERLISNVRHHPGGGIFDRPTLPFL